MSDCKLILSFFTQTTFWMLERRQLLFLIFARLLLGYLSSCRVSTRSLCLSFTVLQSNDKFANDISQFLRIKRLVESKGNVLVLPFPHFLFHSVISGTAVQHDDGRAFPQSVSVECCQHFNPRPARCAIVENKHFRVAVGQFPYRLISVLCDKNLPSFFLQSDPQKPC